ncbi:MAG TPA: glucuronoxylanase XynC [Bacteroidales bacterium]|nr:glucuronoxylanase XynC [Bacteroidales bacterium]
MNKELHRSRWWVVLSIFILSIVYACNGTNEDPPIEVIDPFAVRIYPAIRFQVIRGFGGATAFHPTNGTLPTQADFNTLFGTGPGQLGLTILRIRLASDDDPTWRNTELNHALMARALGAKVIASPWSPPIRMKTNNNLIGGTIRADAFEAYARYLNDFARWMSSNGAPLYAVSIQNEPDITVSYESCHWSAEQMRDFLRLHGHLITETLVMAPESFNFNQNFSNTILQNAQAAANLDIVAGHIYGGGLADYPLARTMGKELWMTEILDLDTTFADALLTARQMHDCMVVGQYSAYLWWYLRRFYGPIGEDGRVTKRGWVMANFSKFIRPGYFRIAATVNPSPGIHVSAYEGPNRIVIVALNSANHNVQQSFQVQGRSYTHFTSHTTSQTQNLVMGNRTAVSPSGQFSFLLPSQSLTTIVLE